MTKVFISPHSSQVAGDNGVGRVVLAQFKHLPRHGIELVSTPDHADVIACHITADGMPRVDVLHCHGLYWANTPDLQRWHHEANKRIVDAARQALAITVPSEWVSLPFKRDMRLTPHVIGHGIDLDEWGPGENKGYILWNKNRIDGTCWPDAPYELARRGHPVFSTFSPFPKPLPSLTVTGPLAYDDMRQMVRNASVYLATTKETFGIGTLEALAAGVPVLGYDYGGTADILAGSMAGRLVRPGDFDALEEAYLWLVEHREACSRAARRLAERYTWDRVMGQYAALYREVAERRAKEKPRVSVVISAFNYGKYITEAMESAVKQTHQPCEVIVVDDGSTDDTWLNACEMMDWAEHHKPDIWIKIISQANEGVAAARNRGIDEATGDLIVCLDADDRLDSHYIERSILAFRDRSVGIACPRLRMFKDGEEPTPYHNWPPERIEWEFQATPSVPPSNQIPAASMFRRAMWERAGGYQQEFAPGEDAEFWTRGLSVGYRAVRSGAWYDYRLHEGSASRTKQYRRVDDWLPWMRDREFPMAAPQRGYPIVRDYSEPVVSVIIPVGPGHARYLPDALKSLLGQTFRQWEAIIINDSGEPLSPALLKPFPFCRTIETAGKVGAGLARNLGVMQAIAPLVLFLDADDLLASDALSRMVDAYNKHGGSRYVYSDWVEVGDGDVKKRHICMEYDADAMRENCIHAVTALVPRSWALDNPFTDLPGWEEWAFYLGLATKGHCGVRVPEALLYYRVETGTRRIESHKQAESIRRRVNSEYGALKMCGCGQKGAGKVILELRQSIRGIQQAMPENAEDGIIRYTGGRQGAYTIQGVNGGRQYRITPNWQAAIGHGAGQVHPDDVARILSLPGFALITYSPPPPPDDTENEPIPVAEVAEIVPETPKATRGRKKANG